ncbi:unnamed protein product [Prunus armeniaca]
MVELFKEDAEAPLCFQSSFALASHTWVSKNLSRSYPTSEAGIYDAILLSKQSMNMDENLLAVALCFWNSASNTLDFRVDPMTPTFLGMGQIFGFRPHGRHANAVGDYHRGKNYKKLAKKFTISPAMINHNCFFSNYLKRFSVERDRDQQHMLFQTLHNHTDVGLGPTVLAYLYENLHSTTLENPLNISAPGPFWMIQI